MASRPDQVLLWSQAGGSSKAEVYGKWWVSVPLAERARNPAYMENQEFIQKKWDKTWGDRLTEIVLIGQNMDGQKMKKELEACLCNEAEISYYMAGGTFSDAWPI
jgi:G3E family GTPase